MPLFVIVAVVVGLIAVRFPIVNDLAGWLVVFPVTTLSGGTIARAIATSAGVLPLTERDGPVAVLRTRLGVPSCRNEPVVITQPSRRLHS